MQERKSIKINQEDILKWKNVVSEIKKNSLGGLNSIMVMVQEERFSEYEGRSIEII